MAKEEEKIGGGGERARSGEEKLALSLTSLFSVLLLFCALELRRQK